MVLGKLDNIINSPDISQRKRGRKKKIASTDNINNIQENKNQLFLEGNSSMTSELIKNENLNNDQGSLPRIKDSSYFIEKRKRNTEASARFRARKKQEEQAIHNLCQNLEIENNKLKYHLLLSEKKIHWLEELLLEKNKMTKEAQKSPSKNINSITETSRNYSFLPMNNSFNFNYGNGNEYQEMNINFKTLSPTKSNNTINEKFSSFFSNTTTPIQGLPSSVFNTPIIKNKPFDGIKRTNLLQDMNNPFQDKKEIGKKKNLNIYSYIHNNNIGIFY